jgi:hypothetical protein
MTSEFESPPKCLGLRRVYRRFGADGGWSLVENVARARKAVLKSPHSKRWRELPHASESREAFGVRVSELLRNHGAGAFVARKDSSQG